MEDRAEGIAVGDGIETIVLQLEEWRWLVLFAGPTLIPREPTPAERLNERIGRTPRRENVPTGLPEHAQSGAAESEGPGQVGARAPDPAPSHAQVALGVDDDEP